MLSRPVVEPDPLKDGVDYLFAKFEREPTHPVYVASMAAQLLNGFASVWPPRKLDRQFLWAAALLHDIGWAVTGPNGSGHHKATAQLILDYDWPGVPRDWVEKIALIARYHRKALPQIQHAEYAALDLDSRQLVRSLAALLRVADALDRRHLQRVVSISVLGEPGGWVVELVGLDALEAELEAVGVKGDLLRQELSASVRCVITAVVPSAPQP